MSPTAEPWWVAPPELMSGAHCASCVRISTENSRLRTLVIDACVTLESIMQDVPPYAKRLAQMTLTHYYETFPNSLAAKHAQALREHAERTT